MRRAQPLRTVGAPGEAARRFPCWSATGPGGAGGVRRGPEPHTAARGLRPPLGPRAALPRLS